MKRFISLIALLLAASFVFAACKKDDDDNLGADYEGAYFEEALDTPAYEENVVTSVTDLADFFEIESVESKGENFGAMFNMAKTDNYVIRPLISGEDVSQMPDYARIEIVPPTKEGEYSHVAYYYTNGAYNYVIKVYYLDDGEYNVAMLGGIHALNNGDEEIVTRERYNGFIIVNYLPNETSYAEYNVKNRYFITITGANIYNEKFPNVIEKEALDILSFDEIQISDIVG